MISECPFVSALTVGIQYMCILCLVFMCHNDNGQSTGLVWCSCLTVITVKTDIHGGTDFLNEKALVLMCLFSDSLMKLFDHYVYSGSVTL